MDMCDEDDLTEPGNHSDLDEDEQLQAGCDVDKYVSSIDKTCVNNVSSPRLRRRRQYFQKSTIS